MALRDKQCLQTIVDGMQVLQNHAMNSEELQKDQEKERRKLQADLRNADGNVDPGRGHLRALSQDDDLEPAAGRTRRAAQHGNTRKQPEVSQEAQQKVKNMIESQNGDSSMSLQDQAEAADMDHGHGERIRERIIVEDDSPEYTIVKEALQVLVQTLSDMMLIKNLELRDINSTAKTGKGTRATNEDSKGGRVDDVAFRLSKTASMFNNATQDSRMQQQIIPNVTRIKIEKLRALRRYQAKHQLMMQNKANKKKCSTNVLVFNLDDDPVDQKMKANAAKICPWSYYMENLFSLDDIYLYRAVLLFYAEEYEAAIQDFKTCLKVKKQYKILDNDDQGSGEDGDENEDGAADDDDSDDLSLSSCSEDGQDAGGAALGKERAGQDAAQASLLKADAQRTKPNASAIASSKQ